MARLMRKCIDSLLAQTFKDLELLLIDDGSTDYSSVICDEYILRDSRIRVFHKSNGGLSDARNYGLQRATGKYIIFADPDDWVDAEGLDKLYNRAEQENADMTICDLYREDEYVRHYIDQRPSSLNRVEILKDLFRDLGGFTVNKLIKKDLYTQYSISYPKGIYGCEDQYVMAQFLLNDIRIAYEPVAFYHYMYNANSLTRYYDENTYQMDVYILEMFENLLERTSAFEIAKKNKSEAIFTRAFWNGGGFYSSRLFYKRFHTYRYLIPQMKEHQIVKYGMYLACWGGYYPANRFIFLLFKTKRFFKQILNIF